MASQAASSAALALRPLTSVLRPPSVALIEISLWPKRWTVMIHIYFRCAPRNPGALLHRPR